MNQAIKEILKNHTVEELNRIILNNAIILKEYMAISKNTLSVRQRPRNCTRTFGPKMRGYLISVIKINSSLDYEEIKELLDNKVYYSIDMVERLKLKKLEPIKKKKYKTKNHKNKLEYELKPISSK